MDKIIECYKALNGHYPGQLRCIYWEGTKIFPSDFAAAKWVIEDDWSIKNDFE